MREIITKQFILENRQPLDADIIKTFNEETKIKWIHTSNKLSGYALTLEETKQILEGHYIVERTIAEHIAVRNMNDGIDYIYELAQKDELFKFENLYEISKYFSIEEPVYRPNDLVLHEYSHMPKSYEQMGTVLRKYIESYNSLSDQIDIVTKVVAIHHKFIAIAPYEKCNSRIARALLNYALLKEGYPAIIFDIELESYQNAVKKYLGKNNIEESTDLIKKQLENQLDILIERTEI